MRPVKHPWREALGRSRFPGLRWEQARGESREAGLSHAGSYRAGASREAGQHRSWGSAADTCDTRGKSTDHSRKFGYWGRPRTSAAWDCFAGKRHTSDRPQRRNPREDLLTIQFRSDAYANSVFRQDSLRISSYPSNGRCPPDSLEFGNFSFRSHFQEKKLELASVERETVLQQSGWGDTHIGRSDCKASIERAGQSGFSNAR
jgi:hypothetical protein